MEYYWIFRSAELLSPLSILKEIKNKIHILVLQHYFDCLIISGQQIEETHLLNFLYNIMIDAFTETHKTIGKVAENKNNYSICQEWLYLTGLSLYY